MANIDAMKILGSILNSGALSRGSGSNVLGSVIGAMTGGGRSQGGGGFASLIGRMLGGRGGSRSSGGGLGSIFGGGGQSAGDQSRGGISDILGGLVGGGSSGGTGLGALIGAAMSQVGGQQGGVPRSDFNARDHLPQGVQDEQTTDQAAIMIRAMINAAKADGQVDQEEQQNILGKLGEVTQDEMDFVRRELAQPLDVESFIRSIPRGLEEQVYAISLMAIDLDSNAEARYLHKLAQGIGISEEVSNRIHEQLGAPVLYR